MLLLCPQEDSDIFPSLRNTTLSRILKFLSHRQVMTMKKQSYDFLKYNLEGPANLKFEFENICLYFIQFSGAYKCILIMRSMLIPSCFFYQWQERVCQGHWKDSSSQTLLSLWRTV